MAVVMLLAVISSLEKRSYCPSLGDLQLFNRFSRRGQGRAFQTGNLESRFVRDRLHSLSRYLKLYEYIKFKSLSVFCSTVKLN